jgi:hypothetical protein
VKGVTATLAARGDDCDAACAKRGAACAPEGLAQLNDCGLLGNLLAAPCECVLSRGAEQPAVEEGASGVIAKCLVDRGGAGAGTCEASHPRTRRACPCLDAEPAS